ncbi:MAG: cation diffusion facilitator family transporter [Muribaculaceae bacterium]
MDCNINSTEELNKRADAVKRCTWVGFAINGLLSVLKITAGFLGRSSAMIADGVHSLSDFITDIIVIVFIGVSARGINKYYRYGHGKFETFATMLISVALFIVAFGIFWSGSNNVIESLNGVNIEKPTYFALIMSIVSIVSKEWLYRYTKVVGENVQSMALIANAWHHRSDAFSSIATLVGISGAMFLGDSWRILDPLAAMLVSVFIAIVAYKLGLPAVRELLEVSLSESTNNEIGDVIIGVDGVKTYHNLRTRKNGNLFVLDFHIKVDPTATVVEAHNVASHVEKAIIKKYGDSIINIHIEPYNGEEIDNKGRCLD